MKLLPDLKGKVKLRRLSKTDLAYLHFKLALGIMIFVPLIQSPSLQSSTTGLFLIIWGIVTGAGLLVSLFGLVLGAQDGETRRAGIFLEMTGLTLLMAGPLVFLVVQALIWFTTGEPKALAVMFPYVICAALICRMVSVAAAAKPVVYKIRGLETDGN